MSETFCISKRSQLKRLEISLTPLGSSWDNWKQNMRSLSIGSNCKYTEHTIGMITGMFSHLTSLDVSSSPNCMTDYSMQLINKHLIQLRHLNLDCCGQVSLTLDVNESMP